VRGRGDSYRNRTSTTHKETKTMTRRLGPLAALAATAALLLAFAAPASAAGLGWEVRASSATTVEPGGTAIYIVNMVNQGDSPTSGEYRLHVTLPPEFTALGAGGVLSCPGAGGASAFTCSSSAPVLGRSTAGLFYIQAHVGAGAAGAETASFEIEGGGLSAATGFDTVSVSPPPEGFGLTAFDVATGGPAGEALTRAAGHPQTNTTSLAFDTLLNPNPATWGTQGFFVPAGDPRDVAVSLPPGFVGNPAVAGPGGRCTLVQLANPGGINSEPLCPQDSQVGQIRLVASTGPLTPVPVFDLQPPPGVPARFGLDFVGTIVVLDASVRSGADYGIDVAGTEISQGLALLGQSLELWGVPGDSSHDGQRFCPGHPVPYAFGGTTCEAEGLPRPFFRNPTACTAAGEGLPYTVRADSWQSPGDFLERTIHSHEAPGYPLPAEPSSFDASYSGPTEWGEEVGIDGCGEVPFEPTLEASPSTASADSPSGLDVHLRVPQSCWDAKETAAEAEAALCQSDLRDATVRLPAGMSVNPSSAGGLGACTEAQAGYKLGTSAPFEFTEDPVSCPDDSKIGKVTVTTPLLEEPLSGSVYLAKQNDNPFGSLLAMYMVAEGEGVVLKQAGEIVADPSTGQLTTKFTDSPQQPFSDLHLELFGGERASLRTPGCGTHTVTSEMTGWSGAVAHPSSSFQITQGCGGGFDPKLSAGASNPLAGHTSPFNLRITRGDAEQELGALTVSPPPGLSGYLKGLNYGDRVGSVIAGGGAGTNPFYITDGKVLLTGPYKGAPLSLTAEVPIIAGPFDLGKVNVRNAVYIDPETGQLTVKSDPLPRILQGIPLDVRDVRVSIDREGFTLNPTSCEELQVGSSISSTVGATATPSVRFQVAGCEDLAFKPKLGLKLFGKPHRGAHPKLRGVLRFPKPGGANLASAVVALPHSEFLDQAHIRTICTRVQFAANACPKGSVYGYARATSPIVGYAVQGPVYLRSSDHKLPDMVLDLHGPDYQPVHIEAVGRIDSVHGGIRTSFESTPDLPLSKVILWMKGGRKGLIQNSRDICAHHYRARASLTGQNGKPESLRPAMQSNRCAKAKRRRHRGHRRAGKRARVARAGAAG